MNQSVESLNKAFIKAFSHSSASQNLPDILGFLGEEISCDRISIFQSNEEGFYSNVHEWCREGVTSEQMYLQHLSYKELGSWRERLLKYETITIQDIEEIRESDPEVYSMLKQQGVNSGIVSALAFQGTTFGFFIIENPSEFILQDDEMILPGLRYILSSLVYSDYLIERLEKIGYTDILTGTGNRLGLQNYLETLDHERPVGFVYADIFSWGIADSRPEHLRTEQMLIQAGTIFRNVFGGDCVFRVDTTEFLIVAADVDREHFQAMVHSTRNLLLEKELLTALGVVWKESSPGAMDELIREANLKMFQEKRLLADAQKRLEEKKAVQKSLWDIQEKADISMYHSEHFFEKGDQWLSRVFDENVVMVVIDINFFRLYNDIFGRKSGNLLLESIADSVTVLARENNGLGGYMGNDDFCLMFPTLEKDYTALENNVREMLGRFRHIDGFAPVMGIYLSLNRQENTITMYDRALAALSEIKGSYTEQYRFYNEEHFRIQREDKILMIDAMEGLRNNEFLFYLQPQVNERNGQIIGAEALVRWNHQGRIIKPRLFIEEMEKNGFIFSLDCYIWEEVCRWQRSLIDRGIKPLPVSVNVSKVDFYFGDVAKIFIGLIEKYGLEPNMIGVEITESAFAENMDVIRDVIDRLHDFGMRIYMDDFGRGSSSLSTLYQLNVDGLKTDIRFLSKVDMNERAVSIVESVISMAHMIGMMVIAEGVETQAQRDKLIDMGDTYVQGYYFYYPMPVSDYEELLQNPTKVGTPPVKGGTLMTSRLHFRDMMSEGILNDTLLDNIIGPAAVYREENGVISIVQMNEAYSRLTGIGPEDHQDMERFIRHHYRTSKEEEEVRQAFHQADHSLEGSVSSARFYRDDGTEFVLKGKIFLLYTFQNHKLYMSTILQD